VRWLLPLFLSVALAAQERTVVLLRHAEKLGKLSNAELSSSGRRRAEGLATELAALRPVRLFASDRIRSQQTLAPLGRRLGLEVQVRPFGAEAALAEEILDAPAVGTVVVCAHSDTLGPLARALGYPGWIPEVRDFNRLWLLRLGPKGFLGLEERRQQPLPSQESCR
jgi:broad specificity phosphatase PhoE